ncbi:MAG: alpha/beta hydrolase [Cyanobacteria bacterium REEB65]|nr:alpha/beta hydrolase [Cyanobacteria bacterium REEB65]
MKHARTLTTPGARIALWEYGDRRQPAVILLHGGPGLPGYMSALCKALGSRALIVDYHQRGTRRSPSAGPFRIADHVRDLDCIVREYGKGFRPILVGHSWGAVLALSYAAAHSDRLAKTILIGCGPLDPPCLARFSATINARLPYAEFLKARRLFDQLYSKSLPGTRRSAAYLRWCGIIFRVYNKDPDSFDISTLEKPVVASALATDADYEKRIKSGELLRSLAKVPGPIIAFHGDYDPIPWQGILPHVANGGQRRKTHLLRGMGHMPWLERGQERFLSLLRREISEAAR